MGLDGVEPPTGSRVSVIIPVYGNWALTEACLDSLAAIPDRVTFDVIVVDDCSPDDTAVRLAERTDVVTVTTPRNLGFLGACNLGAESARGDVLVILNNDTVVYGAWLDALVQTLDDDASIGQVASLILDTDGDVMDAGGIVFADGSAYNYGRRQDAGSTEVQTFRDVDYCTGTSFAIRREIFTELGGFDTRYLPAYYEDTDLSFGVRSLGYRTVVQPNSVVAHVEGGTHGSQENHGLKRFQTVNRVAFHTKWRRELAAHGRPGNPADIWQGRYRRPRGMFLICDPDVPTPDRDSGSRRLTAIIGELQDMGYAMYLVAANTRALQPYTRQLQQRGVTVLSTQEQQNRFIREAGPQLAGVLLCRPHVANRYLADIYRYALDTVILYDTVDLAALRMKRQAVLDGDRALARLAEHEWLLERMAIDAADVTFVVSDVERQLLSQAVPHAVVEVLSNIHAPVVTDPKPIGRADLVFVANYQHPPNGDAVHWFVEKILPLIRESVPQATLRLVGAALTPQLERLAGPGVEIVGWVHDLEPVYRAARVAVAPLRFGAGVKGKVAEAVEYGVPLVGTSVAVEGMGFRAGRDVAVADDAESFAAAVIALLTDDRAWRQMAGAGQVVLEQRFSRRAARSVLERVLPQTVARRKVAVTTDLRRH
ncbi:MAG: glycosyltransferase [Actinomycetota bacterium]|nr:glycosyltransferase [Actinomycetota bacterium]